MQLITNIKQAQIGGVCIISSALVNPVFGWALAMLLENAGFIGDNDRVESLPNKTRLGIPIAAFVICVIVMVAVGLVPGIPPLLNVG